jgi:hypothetical protein
MANSHPDYDRHSRERTQDVLKALEQKAAILKVTGGSSITAGKVGEAPKLEYTSGNGVHIRHLPDDEHGLIRISIGGGDAIPINADYCVFRGNPSECLKLLKKAIRAVEEAYSIQN